MAQRYVTDEGVLVIPGAYPSIKVQQQQSGLATTGVIAIVGEAEAGPDYTLESDLSLNFFAPTELSTVIAKYKSGNIVDAFRAAANPAKDPRIGGSPSFIYVVKTNASTKASGSMLRSGLTAYGTLADKTYGALGNLVSATVTAAQAEVAATTGAITYIPGPETGASDGHILSVRVNGGAAATVSIPSRTLPATLAASLNAVTDVLATGGIDRNVLSGWINTDTLALAVNGNNSITITGSKAWGNLPSVGDTLVIPSASTYGITDLSVIAGSNGGGPSGAANANGHNLGAYVVTAVTSTTITATKLRDDLATGVTTPEAVNAVALGTEQKDFLAFSPITIKNMSGTNRNILTGLVTKTVSGAASGQTLTLTLQTSSQWAALPQVGDTVQIPSTAPAGIKAAGSANVGYYTVTAATTGVAANASTITLTRISDGAPLTFGATALAAVTDITCLRPAIDGLGKSLELFDGAGNLNVNLLFFTATGTAVTWLSTATTPTLLTSASEYKAQLAVARAADGVSESITGGGDVIVKIGYKGTTATLTISPTTLSTSVVGGTGANLSLTLANYKTVGDLVKYIAAQTGYTATLASATYGQLSASSLDEGTWNIASDLGAAPGRIKKDAYDFFKRLSAGSSTVQLGTTATAAASGLPDVQSTFFLSGGAKGATTAATVTAAADALKKLRLNFVVPLFSRDATFDITDGLTDSGSTYTIDGVHAAISSHVLEMSKLKTRRHRQGFLSFKGSFADAKVKAGGVANYRCAMTFQDVKTLASDGTVKQFQPWMGAALAAGMQAAGFYRSIIFKGVNCSGALVADGTFTDQADADLEAAIENGLLVMERPETGGMRWNSDQTTYATDESFVFNSIQAIYASDTIALTVAQRMQKAFVGESVADVSASAALSYLQAIMSDMKRLKLIAASDDAPLGYKDAKITISGNAMKVEMELKLAGAIVFIPITFLVTQVVQSAAA
jgi:hypothetical protein